ncbi:MAG: hypothetical protein IJ242_10000 [Clostridia bacterium]|nr:hypothetical protein [Clostridia bacterium]
MKKILLGLLCILMLVSACSLAENTGPDPETAERMGLTHMKGVDPAVRAKWIDEIVALAESLYTKAGGKLQRAHYSEDIYVCKNFTVHLFKNTASKYRMAAYPSVKLVIPNNKSRTDCKPYAYGIEWLDVSAAKGNPFFTAASFRYDENLSEEENRLQAILFMTNVKKGDFFQMSAEYEYGIDAHSLVFISDYDPSTHLVHWTDSNMKGRTIDGERWGYVQFNAEEEIDFFVDAICHKKRGATLYRLRYDIIRR